MYLDIMFVIYNIVALVTYMELRYMAWREKTAWLTLGAMLCAYSLYFSLVATMSWSKWGMLLLFGVISATQGIFVLVANMMMSARTKDARFPADERDKSIARRGAYIAYFVLMAGMIVVGVVMPFNQQGWQVVNAALLALVIAEAVRHIVVVMSYRRGWHG